MYKSEVYGKGGIYAKVVADSIANDVRLVTMELNYPRFIHSEFMTHRMFSRNASSSRAIPVKKMLEQVETNPAMPIYWGKNKPGMQAKIEHDELVDVLGMDFEETFVSKTRAWLEARDEAFRVAYAFDEAGYHKQVVNRLLEPFQFIKTVCTATEWDNFFNLRLHPDAQPEIQELARCMKEAMDKSEPEKLFMYNWHLPYITNDEWYMYECTQDNYYGDDGRDILEDLKKASVARCARVSYLNHDKSDPNIDKDIALHDMLLEAEHMSPFEHVATPMDDLDVAEVYDIGEWPKGYTHSDRSGTLWSGNFRGWKQYRQLLNWK